MAGLKLQVPSDLNQELYFDSKNLALNFRPREPKKDSLSAKVLRVVIFAYGRIVEDKFFTTGTTVTVGASKTNTFKIPTLDLPDRHPLLMYNGDRTITLNLSPRISGILERDGKLQTLSAVNSAVDKGLGERVMNLPIGSKGVLEIGNISIYFEENNDPEKVLPLPFSPYIKTFLPPVLRVNVSP